jgi:hypothetical protein
MPTSDFDFKQWWRDHYIPALKAAVAERDFVIKEGVVITPLGERWTLKGTST